MSSLPIEKLYLDGHTKVPADNAFLEELYITSLDKIIGSISELLPTLSCLTTLSITRGMTKECAHIIAAFVANSQLIKLELLHCGVVVPIINSIEQSSVCTLNFHCISFRNEEAIALVNVLAKHSSALTKLSFIKCTFEHDTLIAILQAIKESKLKTLILDRDQFNMRQTICIAGCIANSTLTKLSLRGYVYMERDQDIMLDAIKSSSLKTLDVRNYSLLTDFNTINYLILHQGLTKFKFSESTFTIEERCTLLDSMQINCSLEHISFDSARVYYTPSIDQLITKMCALLKNPRFKSFDLDYCSLSSDELKRIMGAIIKSSIMSLKFSGRSPMDENIMIVRNLLENYNFQTLKLHFAHYEDKSIEQILPSIQQSSITKFSVSSNFVYVSDKLQNAIESILQIQRRRARGCHTKSARS